MSRRDLSRPGILLAAVAVGVLAILGSFASHASAAVVIPRVHAPDVAIEFRPVRAIAVEVPTSRGPVEDTPSRQIEILDEAKARAVSDADETLGRLKEQAGDLAEEWARTCLGKAFKDAGVTLAAAVNGGDDASLDDAFDRAFSDCFTAGLQAAGIPQPVAAQAGDELAQYLGGQAHAAESDASSAQANGLVYANWLYATGNAVSESSATTPVSDASGEPVRRASSSSTSFPWALAGGIVLVVAAALIAGRHHVLRK